MNKMEATEAASLPQLSTVMNPCAASFKPKLSYADTLKQTASQANQGEATKTPKIHIQASKKLVTGDHHGTGSRMTVPSDSCRVQNTQPATVELPFVNNGSHPSSLLPNLNLVFWPTYQCFADNNMLGLVDHTSVNHTTGTTAWSDLSTTFEGAFSPFMPTGIALRYPNPLQILRVRAVDSCSLSQMLQEGIPGTHGYVETTWLPHHGQTGYKEPYHPRYRADSAMVNGGAAELEFGQHSESNIPQVSSVQHIPLDQALAQKEVLKPGTPTQDNHNPGSDDPTHVRDEPESEKARYSLVSTFHDTDRGQGDEKPRTVNLIDLNKIANISKCLTTVKEAAPDEHNRHLGKFSNGNSQGASCPEAKKKPRLGDGISSSAVSEWRRTNQPPANAPKAPASQRRVRTQAQPRHTSPAPAGEVGTWSQSKRWVSEETKERTAYTKLKTQLQYMGADKSPAIPESPAQLAALRLEITKIQSKKLSRDIRQRERDKKEESKGKENMLLRLMGGKVFQDGLSPFFAWNSCFNEHQPDEDSTRGVKWPSMGELKEEGDKKAGRFNRCFPLPHINSVATNIHQLEGSAAFDSDGTIRWEKKAIKHSSHFTLSTPDDISTPAPVIEVSELSVELQLLIDHIDRIDGETSDEEDDDSHKEC